MKTCTQEFSASVIGQIQAAVEKEPGLSRLALSRRVCQWLGWRSPKGTWKAMSCRVALLRLERRGLIRLPPAGPRPGQGRGQGSQASVPIQAPPAVACSLKDLGKVELVPVGCRQSRAAQTWKALMQRYHYLGPGPLCGAQLRYLIGSERYGYLGAVAFSAAAWRLAARDRWIGWDEAQRRRHLDQVVCQSRFLILPEVKVPHLASHVLGLCARQVRRDWPQRYGIEPLLLESFVERDRFQGTCYRAANWIEVGCTRGRGRGDRKRQGGKPIKSVYLLPLRSDARQRLCQGSVSRPTPIRKAAPADWAEEEFGAVELGDKRLGKRLLSLARDRYARPQGSIPQACGSRAKTKAAYRFLEHPDTTMDRLLAAHYDSTIQRVGGEPVVLAVQDTTSLNYSAHPATTGLGPIGSKPEGLIGLLLHDTMAFNQEGTPLGLLQVQCWARDPADFGKKHRRYPLDIEQKESRKWLESFRQVAEAQKRCPRTMLVSVGDREADIYELFALALADPKGPKLLVRAEHDRLLADGQGHLWDALAETPVAGLQVIGVPRRGHRPAREATLQVRFAPVRLKPPKRKPHLGELTVWAVLAEETDAPEGVEALKWMLLTTLPVGHFEAACQKLKWYALRWGIEVYHRTLKSGCKIEERQLGSADRIEACLAIDMVVAWRIVHLTKLGRETPDVPCTVFFEDAQWKALLCYKTQNPIPPQQPPSLRDLTRLVASLGGFLGRKGDGEPGTKSLWIGLQRLDDITASYQAVVSQLAPHLLKPAVSRDPTYG